MGSKNVAEALERGEKRLREWGVADEVAALRDAWGRDPEADLAIANRLGRHAEPASVDALAAFQSAAADKVLHKEIRRSLFRLGQRGLAVPKPEPAAPSPRPVEEPGIEGCMSAGDGHGDQLLWLVKPRPGCVMHMFAVINDPDGMIEVDLRETSRRSVRAARADLEQRHRIVMVDVDWRYCDRRMMQAYRWALDRGATVEGDYPGMRGRVLREPPEEGPHPIVAALDTAAIRADDTLLAQSQSALEEPEFATWFLTEERLRPCLNEIDEIGRSPLILHEHQRRERIEQAISKAVVEAFGGVRQASMTRRLMDVAYVLHATQRKEPAKRVLAVALALESNPSGAARIPFCETIVRLSVAGLAAMAHEREVEEAKSSLIVTPQQARREAMRQPE